MVVTSQTSHGFSTTACEPTLLQVTAAKGMAAVDAMPSLLDAAIASEQ